MIYLLVVPGLIYTSASPACAEIPYERQTGIDAVLLAGAAGLFGSGWYVDRTNEPLTDVEIADLDRTAVPAIDRGATRNWSPAAAQASDVVVYAAMVAPVGLMLAGPGRDEPATIGVMYLETMLLASGATYLLKSAIGRTRPYAYNPDPRISRELILRETTTRSFPSGHTANAFASLVFFASVHGRLHPDSAANDWVWGGCLATAVVAGYLRYAAGRHFPTDILAGAALGALSGWLVPRLHEVDPITPGSGAGNAPVFVGMRMAF